MSIALGNKKPEGLLEVEKIIWRSLFKLSEGTTAPEDILGGLVDQIPWHRFQPSSQQDSEWFAIKTTPVSAAPAQNILPVQSSFTSTIPLSMEFAESAPLSDNAMDQSTDNRPLLPTPNDCQAMDTESRASDDPISGMNEDTPNNEPITGMNEDTPNNEPITGMNEDTPNNEPITGMNEDTPNNEPITGMNEDTPDNEPIRGMNEDTPDNEPITGMNEDTPNDTDSIEQSPEARISRRSARLALEKSYSHLPPSENSSRSTSPVQQSVPKSSQHQPTTAVKRKAPTGEAGATKLLSTGGTRASPIDVDALHAVLERYPLKREAQVYRREPLMQHY
jgi:hypothetical protein